ncbi:MAG: tetratricopeptide repeat protein [Deltaproteobacteria bacterium]|jgi:tetratricopeptide (TPR) repeat protein|nr:tetratricopeptide repeat protein [Deltaproteobacteria bacterium]
MAAKYKSRKELLKKPDEFITFTGKAIAIAREYQNHITYALLAVVAIGLIFLGYRFFAQRAETKAFSMLQKAQSEYQTQKAASSAAEAYNTVSQAFQDIIKKYGGNAGGKLARVIYANISYEAGQYEKAIALYKHALNDFQDAKAVYNLILNSLGYAYLQMEDNQNAAAYFERAAKQTDSLARQDALFNLGWVYQKMGEAAKSQQALQQIIDDYPSSLYFDMVQEELSAR